MDEELLAQLLQRFGGVPLGGPGCPKATMLAVQLHLLTQAWHKAPGEGKGPGEARAGNSV